MEKRIFKLVSDSSGVKKEELTKQSRFIDDLGMDSWDHVELILDLEREYSIDVSDEDVVKIKTVGELIEYLGKVA